MRKKAWLFVLPLVASLAWVGAPPSHAAGESWRVIDVLTTGCEISDYDVTTRFSGLDESLSYWVHYQTFSDGKVYGNEGYDAPQTNVDQTWTLGSDFSYAAMDNQGAWPLTPGKPVKAVFMLERPKGTVLSSWTIVVPSCDSATFLYNGPTAADTDEDFVATPTDLCPALQAFTANGCPVRDRSLTLRAKYDPKRVVGKLSAAGYPDLYAGRTVQVWKKRTGPDRLIATRTTSSLGKFKVKVRQGRYYATAAAFISATSGEVLADTSNRVRIR
jgi:hypothetical protein